MKIAPAAALLAVGLLGGCNGRGEPSHSGNGRELTSLSDIGVGCPAATTARLTLAGDAIPVALNCTAKNGLIDVKLSAHDALFEEERYQQTADEFLLIGAAGETYEPPVVLARAPMHIGDSWSWSGSMRAGDVAHAAKATVTTSTDRLFLPVTGEALRVDVSFEIDGGGPKPYRKSLSFWLEPKLGVIRRKFGDSSLREPVGP